VKVQEFVQSIGKSAPPLVVLLCPFKPPRARDPSFEPFLAEKAVERLIATYVDPQMKDLAYAAFYADETQAGEIVLEAQTVPFLAERRVVLVRNAERYNVDAGAGALLAYLKSPCDSTLMILVASQVDKRTKFYKACEQSALIVECPQLREREAAAWVRAEVAARSREIEPAAVEEIAKRAGTHLSDLNNALDVVCGFIGDATTIREEDVINACADVAEQEIWALTDAIAVSDPGAALVALRKLLDLGKHEDQIIGSINWLLKSAYAVAVARGKRPAVSPYVAEKVAPLAGKLGLKKLRDAFALCTDAHFMIRSTGVDGPLALELLVVKLAAPRGGSSSPQRP